MRGLKSLIHQSELGNARGAGSAFSLTMNSVYWSICQLSAEPASPGRNTCHAPEPPLSTLVIRARCVLFAYRDHRPEFALLLGGMWRGRIHLHPAPATTAAF